MLTDVRAGVRSPLEGRWLHDVERAHGLPAGRLNHPGHDGSGRVYRDVDHSEDGLLVETGGRLAHPVEDAFRDRGRHNRATVQGLTTLRYGWREIAADPCGIAAEVAAVLHTLGWRGSPRACSPSCPLRPGER